MLIAFASIIGCDHNVGNLSINLIWPVDPSDHPIEQLADTVRISVLEPNGDLILSETTSTSSGTMRIPEVSAGVDRVIRVEGIGPEGNRVSCGQTGPLRIPRETTKLELFMGRINRFNRVSSISGEDTIQVARAFHTATLLPDGDVLLAGGATLPWRPEIAPPPSATRSIERIQANSLRFAWVSCAQAGQCLIGPRLAHTSTLLPTGNVLLIGGNRGGPTIEPIFDTEIYSPARGVVFQGESLPMARWNHAVSAHNGGFAIVSGQVSNTEDGTMLTPLCKLYRSVSETSAQLTDLPQLNPPRRNFALTSLPDGRLLASGGMDRMNVPLNRIDALRASIPRWESIGSLRVPRAYHTATLLEDGSILFIGGLSSNRRATAVIERLSADGVLSEAGTLRVARWAHTTTLLPNGQILVLGGFGNSVEGSPSQSCEVLQQTRGRLDVLQTGCPMKTPRAGHTATLLPSGWVLVVGGVTESEAGMTVSNTAEVYIY